MERKKVDIYKMNYDCPHNKDGTMRPNLHLGRFEVTKQISTSIYSEEFIGIREGDKKTFLVKGREKSGIGGGTSYTIKEVSICGACGQTVDNLT